MRRRNAILFVALVAASASLLVEACATSGTTEDPNNPQGGNDAGGSAIDSGPILGGDSGGPVDSGKPVGDASCRLTPPDNKCGVFPQCGCNGTTCDFEITTGFPTACAAEAGTDEGGAACVSTGDCAPGLTCLRKRCHEYCGSAGATCSGPEYSRCYQLSSGSSPILDFLVCGIRCDLADAGSCGGGKIGCVPVDIPSSLTSDCQPVGDGGTGAPCAGPLDCLPGFDCVDNGSGTKCAAYCKISDDVCPAGTGSCTAFSTAFVVDGTEYGICQ